MDTANRDGPPVPKLRRRQFSDFSLGLEFLNETEKEKNNGKGDSVSAPSRFASQSEGEMQQILTERHSGKTKQMTNWSVSTFKGKLKTRAFNSKFEVKPIPILLNISLTANNHF